MMLTRRRLLPRRLQRYLIEFLVVTVVFSVVVVVILPFKNWLAYGSLCSNSNSNEEDFESDFYHLFEMPSDKPSPQNRNVGEWFEDGRRRVVNTSEGLVMVKDIMLVPENPLPNGANLYRSREKLHWTLVNDKPDSMPLKGLDRLQQTVAGGLRQKSARDVKNGVCTTPPCPEYLSALDMPLFQHCSKKSRIDNELSATTCSFRLPDPQLSLVALVSPPGSGMNLLRWFLQELTGLCTGSLQCDTGLRRAGYAGENVRTTAVLGVAATGQVEPSWRDRGAPLKGSQELLQRGKPDPGEDSLRARARGEEVSPGNRDVDSQRVRGVESSKDVDTPAFDSAVYLLRNPFDAILEEWSQQQQQQHDRTGS